MKKRNVKEKTNGKQRKSKIIETTQACQLKKNSLPENKSFFLFFFFACEKIFKTRRNGGKCFTDRSRHWKWSGESRIRRYFRAESSASFISFLIFVSGDDAPRSVFRTIVGRPLVKTPSNDREQYIGDDCDSRTGTLSITSPMEYGFVKNWDDLQQIWQALLFFLIFFNLRFVVVFLCFFSFLFFSFSVFFFFDFLFFFFLLFFHRTHTFAKELRIDPKEHPILLGLQSNRNIDK